LPGQRHIGSIDLTSVNGASSDTEPSKTRLFQLSTHVTLKCYVLCDTFLLAMSIVC